MLEVGRSRLTVRASVLQSYGPELLPGRPAGAYGLLLAAVRAGLCLMELVTCQRPCPDSLYACLYRWAGEAAAFAAGWLSLLHQGAAVACVARLQSSAIDALSGGALARAWHQVSSGCWALSLKRPQIIRSREAALHGHFYSHFFMHPKGPSAH